MKKSVILVAISSFVLLFAPEATSANEDLSGAVVKRLNNVRQKSGLPAWSLDPALSKLTADYLASGQRVDACDFLVEQEYRWRSCQFAMGGSPSDDANTIANLLAANIPLQELEVKEVGFAIRPVGSQWVLALFVVTPLPVAKMEPAVFLKVLNRFREDNGLGTVAYEPRLNQAAAGWAKRHLEWQLKGQHKARGSTPQRRIKAVKYPFANAAENVGRFITINAVHIFKGWEGSPGHRSNMLLPEATQIGLSCAHAPLRAAKDLGEYVCVLVLARPG